MIAFKLLALAFIVYAMANIWRRPGLFAAVALNSFVYSIYFGPLGIVTTVIAIVVVGSILADSRYPRIPLRKAEWALIAWLAFSVATVLVSWQMKIAFTEAGQLALYFLANYGMGRTFGARSNFVRDLVIGSIVTVLLCEPGMLLSAQAATDRMTGNLNAVGASLMVDPPFVALGAIVMFEPSLSRLQRAGLLAFLLFVIVPIAVSMGTRGVFVGAAVAYMVFLVYQVRFGGFTRVLAWTGGILGACALLLAVSWTLLKNSAIGAALGGGLSRLIINFASGGSGVVIDRSAADRIDAIHQAIDLILAAPLFGHGIGSFAYLTDQALGYPHNTILEILVGTGLVGFTLFIWGVLPIVLKGAQNAAQRPASWESILIIGLFVDTFARMQLSMSITMGKILFLSLGMIVARSWKPIVVSVLLPALPDKSMPAASA